MRYDIKAGRFHPPSSRTNFNGPYFLNTWEFPFVQTYQGIFAGRDEGFAIWGQIGGGKFKYQFGAFEGREGGPNEDDDLLYTGRLTFNFWDPEHGYYNKSSYYGEKDILAIGIVGLFQNDGAGSVSNQGDFTGWSIDFMLEKKLTNDDVVNLEAAFYNNDLDGASAGEVLSGGNLIDGHSWFALASYMFPWKLGWGKVQPTVRCMNLDREHLGLGTRERWEVGANYIIKGHDARVNFFYGNEHPGRGVNDNENFSLFVVGLQLQR